MEEDNERGRARWKQNKAWGRFFNLLQFLETSWKNTFFNLLSEKCRAERHKLRGLIFWRRTIWSGKLPPSGRLQIYLLRKCVLIGIIHELFWLQCCLHHFLEKQSGVEKKVSKRGRVTRMFTCFFFINSNIFIRPPFGHRKKMTSERGGTEGSRRRLGAWFIGNCLNFGKSCIIYCRGSNLLIPLLWLRRVRLKFS